MDIKPIPTRAFGILFRSRLEARWATYFRELGIEYFYEYEGFDFGGGLLYLPDFWLPQVSMWAEVKPGQFSDDDMYKCAMLQKGTGFPCLMLDGAPAMRSYFESPRYDESCGLVWEQSTDYVLGIDYLSEHRFYSCTGEVYPNPEILHGGFYSDISNAVAVASNARFWE